jgi:serine protease Do
VDGSYWRRCGMMVRTGAVILCAALCSVALGATAALAAECCVQQTVILPQVALAGVVAEPEPGKQGWLGVSITDVTDELRKKEGLPDGVTGVLVLEVSDGGPAEKADVKNGDVITTAAGAKVEDVAQLVDLVSSSAPGKEITITVLRDGKSMTLKATLEGRDKAKRVWIGDAEDLDNLGELEDLDEIEGLETLKVLGKLSVDIPWLELGLAGTSGRGRLGVYIGDLSEGLAEHFGVPGGKGVLVQDIVEGSPAEKSGIAAGDVILKVGDQAVSDTDELREAISDLEAGAETPIVVWRDGKQQTLKVTVEGSEGAEGRKAYIRTLHGGDGTEVRKIVIGETEDVSDLRETIDELKTEIQELKDEIRQLEKESKSD